MESENARPALTSGREMIILIHSGGGIWGTDNVRLCLFVMLVPVALTLRHHWLLSPLTSAAAPHLPEDDLATCCSRMMCSGCC